MKGGYTANMATQAVPNEISNKCNMATKSVLKEMENEQWSHLIVYQMAYQRINKLSLNGISNGMPNLLTSGLPNHSREANEYSTKAANRDADGDVDLESTEAEKR